MSMYYALMRAITVQHAKTQHEVAVHDPYECEEEECRLCRDFRIDEKIDRIHDEGKERI